MRKAGIEPDRRNHDAKAVWSDYPHGLRCGRPGDFALHRAAAFAELAEAGRDNDGCARTLSTELPDDAGDLVGGRSNYREIGCLREVPDVGETRQAGNARVLGIDEIQDASEAPATQIGERHRAHRPGTVRGADEHQRTGRKKSFEVPRGRHSYSMAQVCLDFVNVHRALLLKTFPPYSAPCGFMVKMASLESA